MFKRSLQKHIECFGEIAQCLLIVLDSANFLSGIGFVQQIFLNLNFSKNMLSSYGNLNGNRGSLKFWGVTKSQVVWPMK